MCTTRTELHDPQSILPVLGGNGPRVLLGRPKFKNDEFHVSYLCRDELTFIDILPAVDATAPQSFF